MNAINILTVLQLRIDENEIITMLSHCVCRGFVVLFYFKSTNAQIQI